MVLHQARVVSLTLPHASGATPLLAKPPRSRRIYLNPKYSLQCGFLIISLGRRNRTLHLYEVTATNLLVFGFSRANAEMCVRLRSVGAATWWWCEKFSCWEGEPQRRLTNTTITSLRTRLVRSNHGILSTASPFFLYGTTMYCTAPTCDRVYLAVPPYLVALASSSRAWVGALG